VWQHARCDIKDLTVLINVLQEFYSDPLIYKLNSKQDFAEEYVTNGALPPRQLKCTKSSKNLNTTC